MNKWIEILIGVILIVVPILLAIIFSSWGIAAIELIKGAVIILVVLAGIIMLAVGISDLIESIKEKKTKVKKVKKKKK